MRPSMPVPEKLRSRSPKSARKPASVEKPPPTLTSPVARSATRALSTVRSGAEPGALVIRTSAK